MEQQTSNKQVLNLAIRRGLKVKETSTGYLIEIPLFQNNQCKAYLPYAVSDVEEVGIVAERLWKNENYRKQVKRNLPVSVLQ